MDRGSIRVFEDRELEAADRILRHISRGGLAVREGRWERVLRLRRWLLTRGVDRSARARLALRAVGDTVPGVTPPVRVPDLEQVAGDEAHPAPQGCLIPLEVVLAAQEAMASLHPVEALGESLVVHRNVLVPRSQPLIHLMRTAIEQAAEALPPAPAVLDVGCGSGVCTLLAARFLPGSGVTATDILPEAVATTRLNAERFVQKGLIQPGAVTLAGPGDLFDPVRVRRFDLILFNAPWVVAPARTRAELALNDAGQRTVERFLRGVPAHLNPGGRVLLGYANHSGEKVMANLARLIAEAGLVECRRHAGRIKTHRKRRSWEAIYVCELVPVGNPEPGGASPSDPCTDYTLCGAQPQNTRR